MASSKAIAGLRRWWLCRSRLPRTFVVLLSVSAVLPCAAKGGGDRPITAIQLKAAFVFNFGKLIEWPPHAFAETTSPFTICVDGSSAAVSSLEAISQNKTLHGRPVNIMSLPAIAKINDCQIVFLAGPSKMRVTEIVNATRSLPILTVSDADGFLEDGGIIALVLDAQRMVFEINPASADRVRLHVGAQLLSFSRVTPKGMPRGAYR